MKIYDVLFYIFIYHIQINEILAASWQGMETYVVVMKKKIDLGFMLRY